MTEHARFPRLSLLGSCAMFLLCAWLVPPAAAEGGTVATPVIQTTGAVQIGTTGTYAIPPAGIAITVICDTADADIYYTLDVIDVDESADDVSDPTAASTPYVGAVTIPEQQNLTAQKKIVFKAKAFKGLFASATASATFINYAIPEFSMKIAVAGNQWGSNTLEFGMKTGATDVYDPLYDTSGAPPPVESAVNFTDSESRFLSVDYRSRTYAKEWRMQVQLVNNFDPDPVQITLTWGAGAGFPLPSVPSLKLVRYDASGVRVEVADLTKSGSLPISTAAFPTPGQYDDPNYRIFYVEYDSRGSLQVNLGPQGISADARWKYRELGNADSDWHESGYTTVPIHPGTYEVELNSVAGLFRPPNQIVTVVGGSAPTVVNIDYMTKQTEATMVVESAYNDSTNTVELKCTFTFSPEVTVTQVVWTFNVPTGWTIISITGLPAGWSADITGNVVTFTYAGGGRAAPAENFFEFDLELKYNGGGDPGDDDQLVVTDIRGSGDGGDVEDPDLPEGTPLVRTATLDVNGDGAYTRRDLILILRYLPRPSGGLGQTGNNLFPEGAPQPADQVDAATLTTNIDNLLSSLDVNGDGAVTRRDLILILRYLPRPSGGLGQAGNNLFPEGAPQPADQVDAATLTQNIQAITE